MLRITQGEILSCGRFLTMSRLLFGFQTFSSGDSRGARIVKNEETAVSPHPYFSQSGLKKMV